MSVITTGAVTAAGSIAAGIFTTGLLKTELGYEGNAPLLNGIAMSYMLTRYYYGNMKDIKPAAVVAGIPLGTTQELSHGLSDREVRYRANGGVFLAHQDGGHQSLRIVGKAYGPNRFVFLNMLDLLFLYGSSTKVDLLNKQSKAIQREQAYPSLSSHIDNLPVHFETENIPQPDGTVTTNRVNMRVEASEEPWRLFNLGQLDEGYHESHMTFPIITRQRVYLSMYIETYSWRQSVDRTGQKQVEYTIFFRKYDPEPRYDFRKMVFPMMGGRSKTLVVYKEKLDERHQLMRTIVASSIEIMLSFTINLLEEPRSIALFAQKFLDSAKAVAEWAWAPNPPNLLQGGFF